MSSADGDNPALPEQHERNAGQTPAESSSTHPSQPEPPHDADFDGGDRVFPIRSVVSVDNASPTPKEQTSRVSPREGVRRYSIIDAHTWGRLQSHTNTMSSNNSSSQSNIKHQVARPAEDRLRSSDSDEGLPIADPNIPQNRDPDITTHDLVTSRFEHVTTATGHAIATGRSGDVVQACEDEPIHIPGAVQSFGALLALHEEADEKLVVRVVSENSKELLGYSPNELFALNSFCDILKDDQVDVLLDHIDFIRDASFDPSVEGPEVFLLSVKMPSQRSRRFWCAIHTSPSNPDLVICEFELEDDQINPLNASGEATPTAPSATLGSMPTQEQLVDSTSSISKPLRVLRSARRRKGQAAAMEVFSILTQIQDQLARTNTLDALLNTATGLVKELTGFHRVLIYQFDMNWNGTVVAELVDPKTSTDLYKGLHFPASDIPKQARDLYRINKVRLLYDRDQLTSRLVCRTAEDLETPLNMTHSYLRAMSPIHIKYLANMEVRASMSISINGPSELWGLISCHSYGQSGMRVSFPLRKMCRLIGDTVSRNIERLSYASRLQARKLINTAPTDTNPSGYIIASSDDLLKLFEADYGALCIRDETKMLGEPTHSQEILALIEYLKMRRIESVIASHNVTKDLPDLRYPPGFKHISGMLYVPLSTGGTDFIVFFRRGHLTEIKWAGNPYDKKIMDGHLLPRKSFQTWCETVLDESREWTETDVETAAVLCLVYGKFIKVWRQKEEAMESSQFTQLLLANSAHEVRTPLNAIVNYLEIALEGALDSETRDSLTKSYSASKSLIYVINDLLDLTNTEKGQELVKHELFDLPQTIKHATDMFEAEAKRKNIAFTVQSHAGLPKEVLGDERRTRQVITNLISNAIQHTPTGGITVEIWRASTQPKSGRHLVEVTVQDTGAGMSQNTLDALFQELEQVSMMDGPNSQTQQPLPSIPSADEEQGKQVLGLGLAQVARIVRNMQGQLGVRSAEGKGSQFKISLQFSVPDGAEPVTAHPRPSTKTTEPACSLQAQDEFMLVDSNANTQPSARRHSADSDGSSRSGSSTRTTKSEADRLITAMQEPFPVRSMSDGADKLQRRRVDPGALRRVGSTATSHTLSGPGVSQDFKPEGNVRTAKDHKITPSPPRKPSPEPSSQSALPSTSESLPKTNTSSPQTKPPITENLRVLVAEDDPINSKIIHKRLSKSGHEVQLTVNGEECAVVYREDSKGFDVVLMDIQVCRCPFTCSIPFNTELTDKQMPIVDGIQSTRMIREFEKETPDLPNNEQVPIFAVSASLLEKDAQSYIDTGFDGWIMKPIDFNRLNTLLDGTWDDDARDGATYQPGEWEKGGWFSSRKGT